MKNKTFTFTSFIFNAADPKRKWNKIEENGIGLRLYKKSIIIHHHIINA